MKHKTKQAVIETNRHLVFTSQFENVQYLAINMFGWARHDTLEKCVEEMKTNHYGSAKKDMPYRIFMLLDTDSDYSVSSAIESLGISENGIPTLLIADTYRNRGQMVKHLRPVVESANKVGRV